MVDQGVRLLMLSAGYSLAALILVALRVADAISWAWLWVLCPLWLPFALTGIAFASYIVVRRIERPTRHTILPPRGPVDVRPAAGHPS